MYYMVKNAGAQEEPIVQKRQPNAIYCPRCGVPRSIKNSLTTFLSRNRKLRYQCPSCGLRITITRGWPKSKNDGVEIKTGDVSKWAKDLRSAIKLFRGV